jgi:hypothetical protein
MKRKESDEPSSSIVVAADFAAALSAAAYLPKQGMESYSLRILYKYENLENIHPRMVADSLEPFVNAKGTSVMKRRFLHILRQYNLLCSGIEVLL